MNPPRLAVERVGVRRIEPSGGTSVTGQRRARCSTRTCRIRRARETAPCDDRDRLRHAPVGQGRFRVRVSCRTASEASRIRPQQRARIGPRQDHLWLASGAQLGEQRRDASAGSMRPCALLYSRSSSTAIPVPPTDPSRSTRRGGDPALQRPRELVERVAGGRVVGLARLPNAPEMLEKARRA